MTEVQVKTSWVQIGKDYLFIALGILCYAFGWAIFLLPYQITLGGTAGVASLIFYSTGFPIQITYFLINAILLLFTYKILGKRFVLRTIFGVLVMTFATWLAQRYFVNPDGSALQILGPNEGFMATIVGALMCGFGLGIVFINNGSTGGTDIIATVINKYRDISLGRVILFFDCIIVSLSYFVSHDWKVVLMGFITLFVITNVLDMVVNSARQSVQFFIFSKEYDKIADRIQKDTGRGVTVIDGQGWYSKQNVKVLMVLAKKSQSIFIFRLVKEIDPNAFISQSSVIGVYGQGFDQIKVK